MAKLLPTLFFSLIFIIACSNKKQEEKAIIKTGAEIMIDKYVSELDGKRVGLVMNQSARVNRVHMLDTLLTLGVNVTSLFAAEHGFRGDLGAGEVIKDGVDQETGLPVYSLYGSVKKPSKEMLEEVDVLIFDMQDVGARFYTYNSTMKKILEAAGDFDKEVWILDRPNPAGGEYVSGWVLEEEFQSFIGSYPIPIAHGLTLGELAIMASSEGWLNTSRIPELRVIKMEGWKRSMMWPETGLTWLPPSPNLPTFEHAYVYLGTCFFEGTTLSEGRGTTDPFLTIGSPNTNIEPKDLVSLSKKYKIELDTISFIAKSISGKSLNPKYEGEKSFGISIKITSQFSDPVAFGIELSHLLMNKTTDAALIDYIYLLSGSKKIEQEGDVINWGEPFVEFVSKRKNYLLYD